jgi:NTP pyrophosphatase (non-canonical NTP hydrolase)
MRCDPTDHCTEDERQALEQRYAEYLKIVAGESRADSSKEMKTLTDLQNEVEAWNDKNFPARKLYMSLLGVSEEVGELCHAHLKLEQGIRGNPFDLRAQAFDAIGDIVIFLAAYCADNGYSLHDCIWSTWDTVSKRDWVADPANGGDKPVSQICRETHIQKCHRCDDLDCCDNMNDEARK